MRLDVVLRESWKQVDFIDDWFLKILPESGSESDEPESDSRFVFGSSNFTSQCSSGSENFRFEGFLLST